MCENLPFNGLLYAELEVIALYGHEHKGNYAVTQCIGGHIDKISARLIMLVHSYRTEAKMGCGLLKRILTLQANELEWWGPAETGQIISIEHGFYLGVKVSPCVSTFVLQFHLDVTLELIIFGENCYHRDFEKSPMSIGFIGHQFSSYIPFLSGQISAKCFESSDGRSLSIGMQYLRRNVLYLWL
jgi:hypothetical protein